jgi:hypothetical protein
VAATAEALLEHVLACCTQVRGVRCERYGVHGWRRAAHCSGAGVLEECSLSGVTRTPLCFQVFSCWARRTFFASAVRDAKLPILPIGQSQPSFHSQSAPLPLPPPGRCSTSSPTCCACCPAQECPKHRQAWSCCCASNTSSECSRRRRQAATPERRRQQRLLLRPCRRRGLRGLRCFAGSWLLPGSACRRSATDCWRAC